MTERSSVHDLVDAYRAGFETFDAAVIAELFGYPCQVTGGHDRVSVTVVETREAWLGVVERILAGYRALGVRRVEARSVRVDPLGPRLAQALVRWGLSDGDGRTLDEFDASYTVADRDGRWRITAVAHNEKPRRA